MNKQARFLPALTGSFSSPADGNPTGIMVEAAYRQLGLNARYINCDVAPNALADAVRGARAMGWIGFNCSLPHKVSVIPYLDDLAESASIIGAVNCVVRDGTRLVGENTDGKGFVASLQTVADPSGQRLVLFGAGGAARAIAVEMALAGTTEITIVNRGVRRGQQVAELLQARTTARSNFLQWKEGFRVAEGTTLVVNATPLGLYPDTNARLDIDIASLRPGMLVADVISNPAATALLHNASARGCRTLDGLGMLVNQAAIGIRLWTGAVADKAVMRDALATAFDPPI